MKNKKKFTFLALALAAGMILGACTPKAPNTSSSAGPEESSSSSSSSEEQVTLVSIAVTAPTKVAYTTADTALDLAGMVVTATYSDQTTQVITTGYTVSQVDFSTAGQKTVTVTYEDKTDSFNITVANQKFTVKFVVDGAEVQTSQVEKGQKASYTGQTPTKAGDANAPRYRFKGWDRDLTQPITADTTFTAVFAAYAAEQVVDNFEGYESNSGMADAWKVEVYKNDQWQDTSAAVSIGSKAAEGNKALRFDGWENGLGFRFLKHLEANALPKAANAIKFSMQIPSINTVKVILKGKVTIAGQPQEPSFTYEFHPTTSEYVEYTIPIAADGWALWGKAGDTIKAKAEWIGIHEDDFVNYLTDVGFFVQGNDGANGLPYFAFVDNVRFVTLDEPVNNAEVETMGQYTRYTGLLNDGHTVKIELGANGAATATVVDMETPQVIQGAVAVDAQKNMTFTSADNGATLVYKAALKNGGQSMKYVSASGAFAAAVTNVDLNAVQVVDNYEQYTTDGQAYYQGHAADQRSGCRGAYYSEYYAGSGSSPWGGDKWSLLGGNGDQLKLKQDQAGAHSGNNYLCMKHSKSVAFRYMQWGLFDGTAEQNNFRGSKFSFWAKTNGLVKSFKVSMYSQPKPTLSTMNQYVKAQTFEQTAALGEWTHFEIDLDPAQTYYGFMIFTEKNTSLSSNESWLYIDDVEVYTANPYAKYEAPAPAKELKRGMYFMGKINGLVAANLEIQDNGAVELAAPGLGMNVQGTYAINDDDVTMTFGQTTYVATIANDYSKLTFKSVNGSDMVAAGLNNLSFDAVDFAENAEFYENDGKMYYDGNTDESTISGARGAYFCDRYASGTASPVGGSGWALLGTGDQIKLDKEDSIDGKQCITFKRSSGANIRYMQWELYKGTAKERTGVNKFTIFLKNPAANELKVKIYVFKNKQVTPSNQTDRVEKEITLAANQGWTPYQLDLSLTGKYYGYGLYTYQGASNAYLKVDAAYFSGPDSDPTLSFFAKKDLTLTGTTNAGAASIKFGENGKAFLTCEAAGFNNVEGTYTMAQGASGQTCVIKIGDNTLTGVYAVDPTQNYKVTFTVTEAGGQFAALVAANTVFSN